MRIYIYDLEGKGRMQVSKWLSEMDTVEDVEIFEDCIEFLTKAANSPPDYCLIRLGADGIPGMKTGCLISRIDRNIKTVFLCDSENLAVAAFEAGAYGYLLYPVEKEKLERIMLD